MARNIRYHQCPVCKGNGQVADVQNQGQALDCPACQGSGEKPFLRLLKWYHLFDGVLTALQALNYVLQIEPTADFEWVALVATSTGSFTTTMKDASGRAVMGSLVTSILVWVDFNDPNVMSFDNMSKLFDLANGVTKEKQKPMQVNFWQDSSLDKGNRLCAFQFTGWISKFQTSNPLPDSSPQSSGSMAPQSTINHLLLLELTPVLDSQNYQNVKITS